MPGQESVINLVRAEVADAIDRKLGRDEAIHAYVTKIASDVSAKAIDGRLSPFYKNPVFQNIMSVVVGALVLLGISSIWADIIRAPLQNFLKINDAVGVAVQKQQYQAYQGEFTLGTTASLFVAQNGGCGNILQSFASKDDIVVPKASLASVSPTCLDITASFQGEHDITFLAQPGEEVYVDVLVVARTTPRLDDGLVGDALSFTKLTEAANSDGKFISPGPERHDNINVRIDANNVQLAEEKNLVGVQDGTNDGRAEYVSYWAWATIDENSGPFHNIKIYLPSDANAATYPINLRIKAFIERNKIHTLPTKPLVSKQ